MFLKYYLKIYASSVYKLRYLSYGKFDHLITWVEKKTFCGERKRM